MKNTDNIQRNYKKREEVDTKDKTNGFICLMSSAMCAVLYVASIYCLRH